MSASKPWVFVFDDELQWAEEIRDTLKFDFNVTLATNRKDWDFHIGVPYWKAIVVDVQIFGSMETGIQLAEKAILDYKIISPIIIISGNANLPEEERKYGNIF